MINTDDVAAAHDQMAAEYDQLNDLWYPWLFAQIHEFIARLLPASRWSNRAVDAGCGTGFQSFLLAQAGYEVLGFDVADALLAVASRKSPLFSVEPLTSPPLFESASTGSWLIRSHRRVASLLDSARDGRPVFAPRFIHDDVTTFDYGSELDAIVCCGSVLSFVDNYDEVIHRMAKALSPQGLLFLEVEQRVNPDLIWPALDNLLAGRLAYEQQWPEILRNLVSPPGRSLRVDYPFELADGGEVTLPIWVFSIRELKSLFESAGLRVIQRIGVHHVTNLIPSTVLHKAPSRLPVRTVFELLRHLDGLLASSWPFWRLGCSAVYCLQPACGIEA